MKEILELLKKKYSKPKQNTALLRQMGIATKIDNLCNKYLQSADDRLVFEVLGDDIAYAIIVIDEEPLVNKFVINQTSETMFEARLRQIQI